MAPSSPETFFYSCNECPRVFFDKPTLDLHARTHDAQRLLALVRNRVPVLLIHDIGRRIKKRCTTCRKDVVLSELSEHRKSHILDETSSGTINCTKCDYSAPTPTHYKRHMQLHKSLAHGIFKCVHSDCEASFDREISLRIHTIRRHRKSKKGHTSKKQQQQPKQRVRPFKSRPRKPLSAQSRRSERYHRMPELEMNENEMDFNFNTSSNSQSEPPELDAEGDCSNTASEQNGQNGLSEETCQTCGESVLVSELLEHVGSHLESGQGICTLCDYAAGNKQDLVDHLSTHYNIKAYRCQYCPKAYHWKHSLVRHHVNSHSVGKSKPFQCGSCDKVFGTAKEERRHALTHIAGMESTNNNGEGGEINGSSAVEELKSPQTPDRKKAVRPFQCQYCEKRFMKKKQCKAHEATHTQRKSERVSMGHIINRNPGSQIFNKPKRKQNNSGNIEMDPDMTVRSCKTCGEQMLLADLLIHIKNHITKDQRQCELCRHVYANVESLREHMHTHYGLEPHKCMICNKTYSLKQSVLNHIIRNHKAVKPLEYYACTIPPSPKPAKEYSSIVKEKYKRLKQKHLSPSPSPTPVRNPAPSPAVSAGISSFTSGIKAQQLRFHQTSPSPVSVSNFGSSPSTSRFQSPSVVDPASNKKLRPINFQCNFCQRIFTTKFSVQRHEAKLHNYIDTDNKRVYKTTYAPEDSDTNGMESQSSESSDNPHFAQWSENGMRSNISDISGEVSTNDYGIPFKSESLQAEIRGLLLEQELVIPEVTYREIPAELY